MLSFSKGKPFAKIVGGVFDSRLLHINDGEVKECCNNCSVKCSARKPCCKHCEMCFDDDINEIRKEVFVSDGILQPVPNIETREIPYIAGPSGSGKSTYAANYIKNYKKIHSKKEVFVFSRLNDDPTIDKLKVNRVAIDEQLYNDPINILEELPKGGLILFDDTDTIQDKKIKEAISKIKNDILETGRHNDIYCVNTSHLINENDRKDSRTMLNEAHSLTIFPKSGSTFQIKYVLKNYFGLSNEQIDEILKLPSRWVTIMKNYPMYVFHEHGAYLL